MNGSISAIEYTLFFITFLLLGLNLANNAAGRPHGALPQDRDSDNSIMLRFANNTFIWVVSSIGQWLWVSLIFERYYSEPQSQHFLDLCTLAKVSLFILENEPEPYHGYYLNCRSPYWFSDCSIENMCEQMKREANELIADRGLPGSPPECLSFNLSLTHTFRKQFKRWEINNISSQIEKMKYEYDCSCLAHFWSIMLSYYDSHIYLM